MKQRQIDLCVDDRLVSLSCALANELINALESKRLIILRRLGKPDLAAEQRRIERQRLRRLDDLLYLIEHAHLPADEALDPGPCVRRRRSEPRPTSGAAGGPHVG